MSKVTNQFLIEKDEIFAKYNVCSNNKKQKKKKKIRKMIICQNCFEQSTDNYCLNCGHEFCQQCWQAYIKSKITELIFIYPCMNQGCKYLVYYSFVTRVFQNSKENIETYMNSLAKKFINENQTQNSQYLKCCPGTDCEYIFQAKALSFQTIRCPNGHKWCFICKQEQHEPVSCHFIKLWKNMLSQSNENIQWISENTKLCPFCHKPVQKICNLLESIHFNNQIEGCHQILCKPPGGCSKSFCYVCSEPWQHPHSDHFKCPNENKLDQFPKKNTEQKIIETYNLHYQNFVKCQKYTNFVKYNYSISKQAKKFIKKELSTINNTIVLKLNQNYEDIVFIKDGFMTLVQAPSKLKWTFCLSYFLENSKSYNISFLILSNLQVEITNELSQLRSLLLNQIYKYYTKEKVIFNQNTLNNPDVNKFTEKKILIQAKIRVINEYLTKIISMIENEEYANESDYQNYCYSQ